MNGTNLTNFDSGISDIFDMSYKSIKPNPYIVGGESTDKNRYSYLVALKSNQDFHICAGSLVSPDVVLTAAHCNNKVKRAEIGRYNYGSTDEVYETFDIIDTIIHPEFNDLTMTNDVMLLKLSGMSSYPLATLNGKEHVPAFAGVSLTVVGWGKTRFESFSNVLKEVELKYVPNNICKESEGHVDNIFGSYRNFVHDDNICATDFDENGLPEDACSGDSGGPLIIKGLNHIEDVQVGLVSWGFSCAHNDFPGVYARVSYQILWIKENTCELSSFNPKDYNNRSFVCERGDVSIPKYSPTDKPSHYNSTISKPLRILSPSVAPSKGPETIMPTEETLHQLTLKLKLGNNPGGISFRVFSKKGLKTYASSPIGTYKNRRWMTVTEIIKVKPGQSYTLLIKNHNLKGFNLSSKPNVILCDGKFGQGKILKRMYGSWGREGKHSFWVPKYFHKRKVEETCSENADCYTERCRWGKCRRRNEKSF